MSDLDTRGGRLDMPRSRGAASGFLLILLGAWGALVPFIGPYFDFAYTPDTPWTWTTARGWLEVLPGAVAVFGGLLLLFSRNRATAMLGGWLSVLAGAWFVVGPLLAVPASIVGLGAPVAASSWKLALMQLAYFYGIGVVIVFLGAAALGRLSVRSWRDVRYARRTVPAAAAVPAERVDEPATERAEAPAAERAEEPATERVAAAEPAEPRRRGLFGRRRQPTTAGR